MINRIERPLANDHPDGSFSVHLFLHRPKTQNSRIIGQYTHNLLGLKTLSFALLLFIHKNMDSRSPNWVRHAKCTWSSSSWQRREYVFEILTDTFSGESPILDFRRNLGFFPTAKPCLVVGQLQVLPKIPNGGLPLPFGKSVTKMLSQMWITLRRVL